MRLFVFSAVVLALIAVLLWTTLEGPGGTPSRAHTATAILAPRSARARPRPPWGADLGPRARRFILAFLDYEVGAGQTSARRTIVAGAAGPLAREILHDDAWHPASASGPVQLKALRIAAIPAHRRLVLVSGSALRPDGSEAFAFVFARRRGRWLAIAPGE